MQAKSQFKAMPGEYHIEILAPGSEQSGEGTEHRADVHFLHPRVGWIDAARGVAMLAIIVGHFSAFFYDSVGAARLLFDLTDSFHVPLFFILTGLTMRTGWMGARKCTRLALSCFVPYIVAGIVCITMCCVFCSGFDLYGRLFGFFYGAGAFRDSILWADPANVDAIGLLWFLPAFFIGKVFASVLSAFHPIIRAFVACLLFFVGASTSAYLLLPFGIQQGMCACWFVTCGMLVSESGLLAKGSQEQNPLYFVLRVVVIVCGVAYAGALCFALLEEPMYCNSDYHNGIVDMFGSACCAIAVMSTVKVFYRHLSALYVPLSWVGRNSMAVFIAHAITLACGDDTKWWLRGIVASGADALACYVTFMALDIAICLMFAFAASRIGWLHCIVYGNLSLSFLSSSNKTSRQDTATGA
ncbi:acyltransferase family protein [Adlercreutzia sp. ZJ154]|uniref:acyltransferase family protein n=1 Tax=Adlercreutzia sp. ZJ154 TaxID=2709790 RepID=UPI0013EC32DB|nr:acyltransferase family protein [Adlercreutzia sp. ZJ154]